VTPSDSLVALLGAESFLLAALAVSASLSAPQQERTTALPVGPEVIGFGAALLIAVLSVGAVAAWCQIYGGGSIRPLPDVLVAVSLLVAVVGQPILAGLAAWSLKSES
jgi:hypothetical protein